MSFRFKTKGGVGGNILSMKQNTANSCPFQSDEPKHQPTLNPVGQWPPGPHSGLTGWHLLSDIAGDPLAVLTRWQREFGDLVHLRIWPEHEVVVTDPVLVRDLLIHHHEGLVRWERGINVFSQAQGHGVFVAEGAEWQNKRHALLGSFTPKAVHGFLPNIVSATDQALADWPASHLHWPIESALTSLAMDVIVRLLFSCAIGADVGQAEHAVQTLMAEANSEMYWPVSAPIWAPWKRAKRQSLAFLDKMIDSHVQARLSLPQAHWPEDLLTRLLSLHKADAQAWPLKAVRDECMTTFLVGHETVAATLTWWAWCMASNPQAQTQAKQEVQQHLQGQSPSSEDLSKLTYLTQTLKETLRLYPAAPLLFTRRLTQAVVLGPWQLPAKTMLVLPIRLMHLDPRWFADPCDYKPERFDPDAPPPQRGSFLPFGVGPRVCLGQHLAMMEMTVIAAMVLQRFTLSVPSGASEPKPKLNVSLRPEHPLHLVLD